MKKLLKIFSYLPIILVGIAGSVVVVDMWHIAGVGRNKIANTKHDSGFDPNLKRSPEGAAARATP